MPLLPEHLRARLPPLFAQEAEDEPYVYGKLILPGTDLCWYLLEAGDTPDRGLVLGCLFAGSEESSFGHLPASLLEAMSGPSGQKARLDETFTEGKLTDVVPAPE